MRLKQGRKNVSGVMSKSHVTVSIVLAMLFLAIVGFCIWSVIEGGSTELILGGAIITLGLAQLLSFTARDQALSSTMRRVSDIVGAYGALSRELHAVTRRVSTVESYGMIQHADTTPSREWMQRACARSRSRRLAIERSYCQFACLPVRSSCARQWFDPSVRRGALRPLS
jgi:hypothetical protein